MLVRDKRGGFTLIELLVVIAIIAILAVVVVLTLNPAELLRQSRDANRVSDIATLTSALNLYTADVGGSPSFNLGLASDTYPSIPDPAATSTNVCGSLGLPALSASAGQVWLCTASSSYRSVTSSGWMPVNLSNISVGSPIANLPIDPLNQTSTGSFYVYNTNGSQFQVTANLESAKYKTTYGNSPQSPNFPEVISGGTQNISSLYNTSGMVGYWPMNEGVGSTTADQSGNGDTLGFLGGPTNGLYFGTGKVGNFAGAFNQASTTYANLAVATTSPLAVSGTVSMGAWVYPTNNSVGYDGVIVKSSGSNVRDYAFYLTQANVSAIYVSFGGTNLPGSITLTKPYVLNAWNFFVVTANGTTVTAYLNGASDGSISSALMPTQQGDTFAIGYDTGSACCAFPGFIDDARVYNRILSAAEVSALYNAEK